MFIVIELQTADDGTFGNFVWAFNTQAEAEAKYHAVLSVAATSSVHIHAATILRNDGMSIAFQSYTHNN